MQYRVLLPNGARRKCSADTLAEAHRKMDCNFHDWAKVECQITTWIPVPLAELEKVQKEAADASSYI